MIDLSSISTMTVDGDSLKDWFIPKQSRLPEGYQEVEYIQSHGTEYINTGYYHNAKSHYELDFQYSDISKNQLLFGQYNGSDPTYLSFGAYKLVSESSYFFRPFPNNASKLGNADTNKHNLIINMPTKTATMNGTTATVTTSQVSTSSRPFYLFARNGQGTADYVSSVKIYRCTISEDNILIRDFVPCYRKSDNVIGLYDTVNNHFYTNNGTGTFAKGDDVGKGVIWQRKEPYIFQDDCTGTTVTNKYTVLNTSQITASYTSYQGKNCLYIRKSSSGVVLSVGIPKSLPSQYTIEFDLMNDNFNTWNCGYLYTDNTFATSKALWCLSSNGDTSKDYGDECLGYGSIRSNSSNFNHIKITANGNQYKLYVDGVQRDTMTMNRTGYTYLGIANSFGSYISNITIKQGVE